MKHECNKATNGKDWAHCAVCGLRLHLEACTTKRRKGIDCLCVYTEEYLVEFGVGSAEERASILSQFKGQLVSL